MNAKTINFTTLDIPDLLETAKNFPSIGSLCISKSNLVYLSVDNRFIHQLFPLLKNIHNQAYKPDYFGERATGAHVSVIYPEEYTTSLASQDLGQRHHFKVNGIFSADLGLKRYYVLGIESESLIALRSKYNLSPKLYFKQQ
ncbi:hypothetical protein BN59_00091 [Legionella massiliensis]|uniref:Swiss Army Knife 2H phosphoesterase domain-containing protein n=1 Tax=Legionella massiliensis TaxID=1034943 RepID=A0A078KS84_9GAMM|nr:hypothetical protein [Legionella massiliensis]CDZ75832.1 hypothetical protein BN59_00091 [Legionella massiliensis]CEE11570.1 hypothetical protein BN1094_00091 [Legionella massiliensis]